jgi:hypothetical protein
MGAVHSKLPCSEAAALLALVVTVGVDAAALETAAAAAAGGSKRSAPDSDCLLLCSVELAGLGWAMFEC